MAGIYIMQNTMVRGGLMVSWEKNKNKELREKMKRGKEKRRKITLKNGKKSLKNASSGLYAANLFV